MKTSGPKLIPENKHRKQLGGLCLLSIFLALILVSCSVPTSRTPDQIPKSPLVSPSQSPSVPAYSYRILHVYPHDIKAFTEGLAFDHGALLEGTGLEGQSSLRRVDITSGSIIREYDLPARYFGEGITSFGDNIFQLTYTSQIGFVYDLNSLALLRNFSYSSEGWGLTQNGHQLIMSDGTSKLSFLDPQTLKISSTLAVSAAGTPVEKINELEYVNGDIYANIWPTNTIAIIDPANGRITGWVDMTGLLETQKYNGRVDVLNGIAYDPQDDRLFVTGKWWPYLFEIKILPSE